jgi:hypothetical protein
VRCFEGLKSTAHWLGWACSMAAGTAREHLRIARALPALPLTVAEFSAGRLSYSKVREITRVADRVDEEVLVEMARAMTASQLARTVSSFRAVDGTRLDQDSRREARWQRRDDGMVEIRAVLPAEMGAELVTALELALDRDGTAPPARTPSSSPADLSTEEEVEARCAEITLDASLDQRRADALGDLARSYLAAEPDDRSGEDRHLVIVQVSADALRRDVPAGTPPGPVPVVRARASQHCAVLGAGPLEPRTAERLACTGKVSLAITAAGGEILHLGRSRRLASRAQRRALRLRDVTCVFPGCHQTKHLDAHHLTPWSEGGVTDLDQLALLCRRHHVMVHEGGLRLVRAAADPAGSTPPGAVPRFRVLDSEGNPVQARWPAMFEHLIVQPVPPCDDTESDAPQGDAAPETPRDRDPERIAATTGGEGFSLAECVQAMCQSVLARAA